MSILDVKKYYLDNNHDSGIFSKKLLDLSISELRRIEKIAFFNDLSIKDVKNLEKQLLNHSITWDDSVIPFFIMSIVGYYLDNNFYTDLQNFISNLKLSSLTDLIQKILDYLKNFKENRDIYYILLNRFQSLLTYYSIYEKEVLLASEDVTEILKSSEKRLEQSLDFLGDLDLDNINDNLFRCINSIFSYTNYELPFLKLKLDFEISNKIQTYLNYFLTFLEKIEIDHFKQTSILAKVVFLNNIHFLYQLSENIDKNINQQLKNKLIEFLSVVDLPKKLN